MTRPRKSTSIRNARRASIERKRGAFGTWKTPNKKPGFAPGFLNFDVAGRPTSDPATNYPHSNARSTDDEICN